MRWNFDFKSLKSSSPDQFLGSSSSHSRYHWIFKLKNQRPTSKDVCGFSIIFILKEFWGFAVKESMVFVEQKYQVQLKRDGIENGKSHTQFYRWTMCFSSYKNCELKVKLRWVGAREWKNRSFFVTLILSEENFLNIWVLSQGIVYWIMSFEIYVLLHIKKALLHTLFIVCF